MHLLERDFFDREPQVVAPELVGKIWVVKGRALRLNEVEAYGGGDDLASHAYRGCTPRCVTMFGEPGTLYVYFTYGMHHCANIVAHHSQSAGAILIRGVTDVTMALAGQGDVGEDIVGPGRICAYLGLDRSHSGYRLEEQLAMVPIGPHSDRAAIAVGLDGAQSKEPVVRCGPRVGVSRGREAPWRFWDANSGGVSRYRPGRSGNGAAPRDSS